MTSQRDLDRLLGVFFATGVDQVSDRVIEGALAVIERTPQRRPMRVPARIQSMPILARLAVAAAVGVIAVGATLYVTRPDRGAVGGPSHSPAIASPSASSGTARPASWALTGNMTTPRMQQTATRLLDGRVLMVGGNSAGPALTAERTAELYDPMTRTWTATGSMIEDRLQGHTATLLPDGKVLVAGGRGAPGQTIVVLASAELYDPATGTWTATGRMTVPRMDHTATLLPNGKVLVAGGVNVDASHALASAELYDPTTGSWSATGSMSTPRAEHTATLLSNGKVLVAGAGDGGASASAELYDPATGTWAVTGNMITPRSGHTATLLDSGKVLVAGGLSAAGGGNPILGSAEFYDPATGAWTATGIMTTPRADLTATLLANGQVLVTGGAIGISPTGDTILASAELYDPGTGTWSATQDMADVRESFTATALRDGTVLIAGGNGGAYTQPPHEPLASAEVYDPGRP